MLHRCEETGILIGHRLQQTLRVLFPVAVLVWLGANQLDAGQAGTVVYYIRGHSSKKL